MHIVTGGAGFIGSNIARALVERGCNDVVLVDDLTDGHKFANIADLNIADYLDKDEFVARLSTDKSFARGITAILHHGACSETTEWNGRYMMQNNYSYSKTLLHHCLEHVTPFIYASSAAVYGGSSEFVEDPLFERPLNVYGYSKLQFDRYVRRIAEAAKSQVVGLRYFNVYGPREQHKGAMASVAFHFNKQVRDEGEARLFAGRDGFADGEQLRDFVYIDDICKVNLWFLGHPETSGIFNVGTGRAQSFNDVANAVIRWHNKGKIRYVPFPEHLEGAYQSYTQADLTQLRQSGCDVEFRAVEDGVKNYLDQLV
ncbi:MAG: ADP-glyceromanno-heptose 6-epimerase [Gammaproteobacteria bacterium]|nr:ADP-glyceromanno-heptose 6-epimerase [Gammaproteobacteria bacterium]